MVQRWFSPVNHNVCFQWVTGFTSLSPVGVCVEPSRCSASTPGTILSIAGAVDNVTVCPARPALPVNITSNHEQKPYTGTTPPSVPAEPSTWILNAVSTCSTISTVAVLQSMSCSHRTHSTQAQINLAQTTGSHSTDGSCGNALLQSAPYSREFLTRITIGFATATALGSVFSTYGSATIHCTALGRMQLMFTP